jgi:hypothetical protein
VWIDEISLVRSRIVDWSLLVGRKDGIGFNLICVGQFCAASPLRICPLVLHFELPLIHSTPVCYITSKSHLP